MSSSSTRLRSSAGNKAGSADAPSREFQMVASLFGTERASLIPEVDQPKVVSRVQQLFGSLSRDQQEVIDWRYNLSGELEGAPVSDHRQIAAKLGRGPTQVNWSLTSAEQKFREKLQDDFSQLKPVKRTPQNS